MNSTGQILLVDDDRGLLKVCSALLRSQGHVVRTAGSGRKCLEQIARRRPHLIVLDVALPDLSGLEVCRQIKANPDLAGVFVILISGEARAPSDRVEGLQAGADDYIAKPVDGKEFLARVRTALRLREVTEALRNSEGHYRRLVEMLPDGLIIVGRRGEILETNAQANAILGFEPQKSLVGKSIFALFPKSENKRLRADLAQAWKAGRLANQSFTLPGREGETRTVELSAAGSERVPGRSEQLVVILHDVSARARLEHKLMAALNLNEAVLAASSSGIGVYREDGACVFVNPAMSQLLGRTPHELMTKDFQGTKLWRRSGLFELAKVALRDRVSCQGECCVRENDKDVWLDCRLIPFKNGNEYNLLLIASDITDRKQSEDVARGNVERFRHLTAAAFEGICISANGRILETNDQMLEMFGFKPGEIIGREILDLVTPDSRPLVAEAIATGREAAYEFRGLRRDGSSFPGEARAKMARWNGRKVRVTALRDITNQKRMQDQLSANERKLAEAMSLANLANWDYDVATDMFIFNDRFYALFATSSAREGGLTMSPEKYAREFLPPHLAHLIKEGIAEALMTADPNYTRQFEHPVLRRDGAIRHLLVRVAIVKDAHGRTVRIAGANQDITERKLAEEALRASEERFRTFAEAAFEGVAISENTTLLDANPLLGKMLGYDLPEMVGKPITDFILPEHHPLVEPTIAAGSELPSVHRIVRKDGSTILVETRARHFDYRGRRVRVTAVHDITERQRAEEQLRVLSRRVIQAQENERQRVARELHDGINQTIAAVKMRLERLRQGGAVSGPAAREILGRCSRLLVQVLEENRRIARNLHPSVLDQLGLAAACRRLCNQLRSRRGLHVQCRFSKLTRLSPTVELNLFRIVQEAVSNMEKYSRAKFFGVQLTLRGDWLTLKIRDDGLGFDLQDLEGRAGSGIGITSMRERALALNGAFDLESSPGKGATITVRVPIGAATPRPSPTT
jgi:PAS domain S-box-containing protein